jgi:hypothetical protein
MIPGSFSLSRAGQFTSQGNGSFGAFSPLEAILRKLDGVRGRPPKCRSSCPACRRKGALSVGEGRDGQALLRCFAGCELRDIAGAIGLSVSDLFAGDMRRERDRERFTTRRHFDKAPRQTVHAMLDRELEQLRARLRAELGYDRPIRSSDLNAVRERVCRMFELARLPPVAPFDWECPPHDDDPVWPTLYSRALEEETRRRWMAFYPEAPPWETDPGGPGIYDRMRAEQLARAWQRSMAS